MPFYAFPCPLWLQRDPCESLRLSSRTSGPLICEVENGSQTKSEIRNNFTILASVLSTIMKNKQVVLDRFEKSFSMKRKCINNSKHPKVDAALVEWLNARGANLQ